MQELLQLAARGVRVLVAAQPDARILARAAEHGIPTFAVKMRNGIDPVAVWRLMRIIRSEKVDVVNTHSGRDSILAGLAGRLSMRALIVRTRHLLLPITSRATYTWLPHHVVAVSLAVRDYLETVGVPSERMSVVPTGVDIHRFDPSSVPQGIRQELALPPEALLVGTVAILRAKKGHRDLIEAVPAVLQQVPNATFVFAGDGPQQENLQKLIDDRGLSQKIRLIGLRRDIPNVLKDLDLFVLPTHQEALGTSLLEAQAMGVPVIGTRTGGVPETMREGETGLLVPVQQPDALAQAVIAILKDHEGRRRMSAAARPHVVANYSVEVMADGMLATYKRLLELHKKAG